MVPKKMSTSYFEDKNKYKSVFYHRFPSSSNLSMKSDKTSVINETIEEDVSEEELEYDTELD